MDNKAYFDYLRVTGFDIKNIYYKNIELVKFLETSKVSIKEVCEGMRFKGIELRKCMYLLGLLMVQINDEDDFRFMVEEVLKKRLKNVCDLEYYVERMTKELEENPMSFQVGYIYEVLEGDE